MLTPSFIAWVHSAGVAMVTTKFKQRYLSTAKKLMAAAIQTKAPVVTPKGNFLFYAYVGSIFPATSHKNKRLTILVPIRNSRGLAEIVRVNADDRYFAKMPVPATPHQFSRIIAALINRSYGWGGLNFYNDCSQELKSLFAPFGIWLPRHSAAQVLQGKLYDVSILGEEQRLRYLINQGHPLMTIVYIGGHVFLYIGSYKNPRLSKNLIPLSYQNIWGLGSSGNKSRSVIGKSVFFPILKHYPEDSTLKSLVNHRYFIISDLDQWPGSSPRASETINLKTLIYSGLLLK